MNWELNTKITRFTKNITEIMEVVGYHKSSTGIDYYILEAESGKCFLYTLDFCHANYKEIINLNWITNDNLIFKSQYKTFNLEIRCDITNGEFKIVSFINQKILNTMSGISKHNIHMMKKQVENYLSENSDLLSTYVVIEFN